jgi:hypothetical protein
MHAVLAFSTTDHTPIIQADQRFKGFFPVITDNGSTDISAGVVHKSDFASPVHPGTLIREFIKVDRFNTSHCFHSLQEPDAVSLGELNPAEVISFQVRSECLFP